MSAITLEGSVVRLVPLSMDHLDALCAVGLDDRLWELTLTRTRNREEMTAYIQTALDAYERGSAIPFATMLKSTGQIVGSTRFGSIDRDQRRVEIGWTWIAFEFQRTAVNTEAKYLMLKYAFEQLNCIRVEFKTDALNLKSRAAIARIGGKEEGIFRSHLRHWSGRFRDTVYYSIIESEWPSVKSKLEEKLRREER